MKYLKISLTILLLISIFATLSAKRLTVIKEVLQPKFLAVDDTNFYVTEGAQVYIYTLDTFQLIKKFGKEGYGPKEFATLKGRLPLIVYPLKDKLQINSLSRISFYSKDGNFLDMIKTKGGLNFAFRPLLPDKYVALGFIRGEGPRYRTVDLYNSKLEREKQLFKIKEAAQNTGPIKLFEDRISYETFEDNIFIQSSKDFVINVLNNKGETLYDIKKEDYERSKFTEKNKEDLIKTIKATPQGRQQFAAIGNRLVYPSHFGAIAAMLVADGYLYTITWKYDKDKFECFVFDAKTGKELKKIFIPFERPSPLDAYPMAVKNGKLYQLVETEDEEWALTSVKLN